MSILRAYGDESGKAGAGGEQVISLGAVIARNSQWEAFEQQWQAMLKRWEIPKFHMKDFQKARRHPAPSGPYAQFVDVMKLQAILHEAVKIIQDCGIVCRAMAVFVNDLKTVMEREGVSADPYSFTLYAGVSMLGTWALNNQPDDPSFELILDRLEKGHARAAEAEELYRTDQFMSWRGWPVITPLPANGTRGSHNILGLQAADLVAWCVRFQLDNVKQWMMTVKPGLPPLDFKLWDESLQQYLAVRREQQREAYPEGLTYTSVMARLIVSGNLRYYFEDEERLTAHVFKSRSLAAPADAVADAVQKAGRLNPLEI